MDTKILILCIGNNGRADDALGWMFADWLAVYDHYFDIEYRYQLQIEDALLVSQYSKVIFVDASKTDYTSGFSFYPCIASCAGEFTTHILTPETVTWLAGDLYGQVPEASVLAISGSYWDLKQRISISARQNFEKATLFFRKNLNKIISTTAG